MVAVADEGVDRRVGVRRVGVADIVTAGALELGIGHHRNGNSRRWGGGHLQAERAVPLMQAQNLRAGGLRSWFQNLATSRPKKPTIGRRRVRGEAIGLLAGERVDESEGYPRDVGRTEDVQSL